MYQKTEAVPPKTCCLDRTAVSLMNMRVEGKTTRGLLITSPFLLDALHLAHSSLLRCRNIMWLNSPITLHVRPTVLTDQWVDWTAASGARIQKIYHLVDALCAIIWNGIPQNFTEPPVCIKIKILLPLRGLSTLYLNALWLLLLFLLLHQLYCGVANVTLTV